MTSYYVFSRHFIPKTILRSNQCIPSCKIYRKSDIKTKVAISLNKGIIYVRAKLYSKRSKMTSCCLLSRNCLRTRWSTGWTSRWSCSRPSATSAGSTAPPSSSSSTRRTPSRRRSRSGRCKITFRATPAEMTFRLALESFYFTIIAYWFTMSCANAINAVHTCIYKSVSTGPFLRC